MSTEIETVPGAAVAAHITEDGALEMLVEGVASVRLVGDSARARESAIDEVVALARRRGGPVELVTSGAEGAWRLSVGIDGSVLPIPEAPAASPGEDSIGTGAVAVTGSDVVEAAPELADARGTTDARGTADAGEPAATRQTTIADEPEDGPTPSVPRDETVLLPAQTGTAPVLHEAGTEAAGSRGRDVDPSSALGQPDSPTDTDAPVVTGAVQTPTVERVPSETAPVAADLGDLGAVVAEHARGHHEASASGGVDAPGLPDDAAADRDELPAEVWPADGDHLDEELERTVVLPARRRPVHRATLHTSAGTSLTVQGAGVIGRRPTRTPNPVRFPDADASMSNAHAAFTVVADGLLVTDQGSLNGTVVRHDGTVVECVPGQQVHVPRGGRVDLGEQFFIVV